MTLAQMTNFIKRITYYFFPPKIIGLTRIRNEQLIIQDTLDHMSKHVDAIIVYDDASTDKTAEICQKHNKVLKIIRNSKWRDSHREVEETVSRQILLEEGLKYHPTWFLYFDADERFEGNIKKFLYSKLSRNINGIRIKLFDAYLTNNDQSPYISGQLYNFRKYFGPEYRDILMIWKNKPHVKFTGLDSREPIVSKKIINKFYCQHYGKSLSTEHWEETCQYYIQYFPAYSAKWQDRRGKSIHTMSDFKSPLFSWKSVKKRCIPMPG